MPPGIIRRTIADKVADLQERVTKLEAPRATVVQKLLTNLAQFKDVRILYKHPTQHPTNGQTLRFHRDEPTPTFHGWWEPSGGERIGGKETLTITSDGVDAGATQLLVPSDWDERQGCTGAVSVTIATDVPFAQSGGDYADDGFGFILQLLPWDIAAGPPSGDTFSIDDIFPSVSAFGVGGFASTNLTVPAVLMSGKPHAFVFVNTPAGVGAIDFEVRWLIRPDGPL